MLTGLVLPVYWPLSFIFIIYLIFIYFCLSLVVQLSQKRFGPPGFGPIIFFLSVLLIGSLHLITLTKVPWEGGGGSGGGGGGLHPRAKVVEKVIREFFFRPYSTS